MRKFKSLLLVAFLTLGMSGIANAQKIGHVVYERVIANMPETRALQAELAKITKTYKDDIALDDAAILATAGIYLSSEDKEGTSHIRMARIRKETGLYEIVSDEQITKYASDAKTKYPHEQK